MSFSEDEKATIYAWLDSHWTRNCPHCAHASRQWLIGGWVNLPIGAKPGNGTATWFPVIPILCQHCAATFFLSTAHVGIKGDH